MTAMTTGHTMTNNQRALVTVVVVVAAHAAVLALLATMKPIKLQRIEPSKPIEVKFVQLAPPPPPPPPPPKPKPEPKPKEVKVVQPVPKPKPKPKPVIATEAVSAQPQVVVPVQPEPPKKVDLTPEPPQPPAPKPVPKPPEPVQPKQVSSQQVSYIRQPKFDYNNDDLRNKTRTIKLRLNISAEGKVESVDVIDSTGLKSLDQDIARAFKKAVFTPYKENGVAMPVFMYQPFELTLNNE